MIHKTLLKFHEDFFHDEKLEKHIYEKDINLDLNLSDDFRVKPSFGVGNKSFVPWIAIYNKKGITTIKEGYYLVYLFSADGSDVYLSLQQGTTNFKHMIQRLRRNGYASSWSNSLNNINDYWRQSNILTKTIHDMETIDLALPMGRSISTPRAYEIANIYGIHYAIEDLKTGKVTSEKMNRDFDRYLDAYIRLLDVIDHISHTHWNEHFCLHVEEYIEKQGNIKRNKKERVSDIHQSEPPKKTKLKSNSKRHAKNPDWNLIQRYKNDLGEKGEIAVLEYIKEEKRKMNQEYNTELIRHVSKLDGDSYGYDILEIEDNGTMNYIEVKTTRKGIETPFFISANELEVSKKYAEHYILYRVYNFVDSHSFHYYTQEGYIKDHFKLDPTNYLCNIVEND